MQLIDQVLVLSAAIALLGFPGVPLVSILRIREIFPDSLAVATGALLGSLVACIATAIQLATASPVGVAVGIHIGLSMLLAVAAVALNQRRQAAGRNVKVSARGWSHGVSLSVLISAAVAWLIRGLVGLDGLYHIALTRKLVELDAPTFNNINRFADGGPNPVYALPGWHAFVGWSGWITGVDPIVAWEIMPVLVVSLAALAAAGLSRVLLSEPRAELFGAWSWMLSRVLFARREVDGDAIRYGAVPGQVVFELAFMVILAAIAIALIARDRSSRRTASVLIFMSVVSIVIYHANYLPFVAIIGVGYLLWWMLASRHTAARLHDAKRMLVVGGWFGLVSATAMAVLVPLLSKLENFGNAPDSDRIDYHLTSTAGLMHVRGGHFFEMLGFPGLIAMLALPWLAWRWRNRPAPSAIVWGGVLSLSMFVLVPWLFQLLRATGSLTLLLRINHPIGILLIVAMSALLLELSSMVTIRKWLSVRLVALTGALLLLMWGVGMAVGYEKFAPDIVGYAAVLALGVILIVCAISPNLGAVHLLRRPEAGVVVLVVSVVTLGLAFPVGAISLKRGIKNADSYGAGIAQGSLHCLEGEVSEALQRVHPGSVILSDPVASFQVMALAPVYVVGDYKVWNAATSDNRAEERLRSVNRFFDSAASDKERMAVLSKQKVDYLLVDLQDGRWLNPYWASVSTTQLLDRSWRGLDAFADIQAYDGGVAARLVQRNSRKFKLVAVDERAAKAALPEPTPDTEPNCYSYALWKVLR